MLIINAELSISVESEPGDGTRYSYFVHKLSPDDFSFAPNHSTFKFPQRINYWDVKDLTDDEIQAYAKRDDCNFYTYKECIRMVIQLVEKTNQKGEIK